MAVAAARASTAATMPMPPLKIARSDVIYQGVAENMIQAFRLADLFRSFADDYGKFRFVIDFGPDRWQDNRRLVSIKRIRQLVKDQRSFRRFGPAFDRVIDIVSANGQNLTCINCRQKIDFIESLPHDNAAR